MQKENKGQWIQISRDCRVNLEDGSVVSSDGTEATLTPKQYEVFAYFVANPDLCISKDILINDIWDSVAGDSTVSHMMRALREIHPAFKKAFTKASRGRGWKFHIDPVSEACETIPTPRQPGEGNRAFREQVKALEANVHMSTKAKMQDKAVFPLEPRFDGIDHMTLLNYAGTTFLRSDYIASAYHGSNTSQWFADELISGGLEADIILTHPSSGAAQDAAKYKMYPLGLKIPADEIIQSNIDLVLQFQRTYPSARINLYLTDICLPYGIMLGESHTDPSRDFMKIDLYSPLTYNDDNRFSFCLLKENRSTEGIYDLFKQVIANILSNDSARIRYTGRNVSWLLKKPIIHRGRIRHDLPEHSINSYWECIKHGMPMEIDLLFLRDGTPIVGRDVCLVKKTKPQEEKVFFLSGLTLEELRRLSTADYQDDTGRALSFRIEELMTLPELLNLVNGSVDLLIEIKEDAKASHDAIMTRGKKILDLLRYYPGKYAIHSSNPNVLKVLRPHNMMVPMGLISWSFTGVDIPEEYRAQHAGLSFNDIGQPDFISYKFDEIDGNERLRTLCVEHGLPLLAWTIRNAEDEAKMKNPQSWCDNIIIEDALTFI